MNAVKKRKDGFTVELLRRGQDRTPSPFVETGTSGHVDPDGTILVGKVDQLLEDMAILKANMSGASPVDFAADFGEDAMRDVKVEIARMVREIGRVKREIAAVSNPTGIAEDQVDTASRQLEAIVKTTEDATNRIMSSVDEVNDTLDHMRQAAIQGEDVKDLIDSCGAPLTRIIEACSFQDLTGQRISQVVYTLRFIETRILAMIEIWGLEAFQDLPGDEVPSMDDGDPLLNGPALEGQGLSQADIDALFD
jgi:chemotaxis protein CheZ